MSDQLLKDRETRCAISDRVSELERVNAVLLQIAEASKLEAEIWEAKHAVLLLEIERMRAGKKAEDSKVLKAAMCWFQEHGFGADPDKHLSRRDND